MIATTATIAAPRRLGIGATRYDAASLDEENAKHWAYAGSLSANSANSPEVRRRLRNRARYEYANNCYCRGLSRTIANVLIGTGPRPQISGAPQSVTKPWETAFRKWGRAIGLAAKLRTLRSARLIDGEAFGLVTHNPGIDYPIQLDLQLIECDRVTDPAAFKDPANVDGINFDAYGNPETYSVLEHHPGDTNPAAHLFGRAIPIPARQIIHQFIAERPEQKRGIPEITAALPLYAQLRRYTLAVIAAAETAADFAAILYTDKPADGEAAKASEDFASLEIEKRMLTQVPAGWRMEQFQAVQPTSTYPDFKKEILNEIARCLNVPYNIAAGNSAAYNYASGRLDHRIFHDQIAIDRADVEETILERLWNAFAREAASPANALLLGLETLPPDAELGWHWDEPEHVDPEKEANASQIRLATGTSTYSQELGRRGQDWEEVFAQQAKELESAKTLGLTLAYGAPAPEPAPKPEPNDNQAEGQPDGDAESNLEPIPVAS